LDAKKISLIKKYQDELWDELETYKSTFPENLGDDFVNIIRSYFGREASVFNTEEKLEFIDKKVMDKISDINDQLLDTIKDEERIESHDEWISEKNQEEFISYSFYYAENENKRDLYFAYLDACSRKSEAS